MLKPGSDPELGTLGLADPSFAPLEFSTAPLRRRKLALAPPSILLADAVIDRDATLPDMETDSIVRTFSESARSHTDSFLLLDEDDPRVTGNPFVTGIDEKLREKCRKEVEHLPPYTREKVAHALEAKLTIECMLIASLCAT